MSPIQSLKTLGFATETTFGTFVVPTNFVPGQFNSDTNIKNDRPDQARATRSQVIDVNTGIESGFTISAELIPEVLSKLQGAWMGVGCDTVTTPTGSAKQHSMVPTNVLPSLSVEEDNDVISQILARQVAGCMVDQLVFRFTNQAIATMQATLLGQREITPATPGKPSNPTPSISTLQPFDFSLLAAAYKGSSTTQLMDCTLTLMNHVQRVFSSNGQLYVARLVPTKREVQLQTTLDFLDTNFYSDWIGGVKVATGLVLTFTSPTLIPSSTTPYSIQYTVPGIRPVGNFQLQAASDVINQQLSWSCTLGASNDVSSVWTNSETAALA